MLGPKNNNLQKPDIWMIPLNECLAKTIRLSSGNRPGVSVETHCRVSRAGASVSFAPPIAQGKPFPQEE